MRCAKPLPPGPACQRLPLLLFLFPNRPSIPTGAHDGKIHPGACNCPILLSPPRRPPAHVPCHPPLSPCRAPPCVWERAAQPSISPAVACPARKRHCFPLATGAQCARAVRHCRRPIGEAAPRPATATYAPAAVATCLATPRPSRARCCGILRRLARWSRCNATHARPGEKHGTTRPCHSSDPKPPMPALVEEPRRPLMPPLPESPPHASPIALTLPLAPHCAQHAIHRRPRRAHAVYLRLPMVSPSLSSFHPLFLSLRCARRGDRPPWLGLGRVGLAAPLPLLHGRGCGLPAPACPSAPSAVDRGRAATSEPPPRARSWHSVA